MRERITEEYVTADKLTHEEELQLPRHEKGDILEQREVRRSFEVAYDFSLRSFRNYSRCTSNHLQENYYILSDILWLIWSR